MASLERLLETYFILDANREQAYAMGFTDEHFADMRFDMCADLGMDLQQFWAWIERRRVEFANDQG